MALPEPETLFEEETLIASRLEALFPDTGVLRRLIERGVLRPQTDGSCKVQFVGVAVAAGRTFQVIPKVLARETGTVASTMRHVVRALRRYSSWIGPQDEEAPLLKARSQPTGVSAIALADWLIRDYLAHGIYRRAIRREDRDGRGQILWSRTIDRTDPILVKGQPAYVSFITQSSARDSEHFVSRLHRHLVEIALARYGHLLGYAAFSLEHEPFEPFTELPPRSLSTARLRQEAREAFSDRAMRLIPMIIALIDELSVPVERELALFGTTTFHNVWERACAELIGNELHDWEQHIPKPIWHGEAGERQAAETFIPDIVTPLDVSDANWLLIADAKYYRLRLPPALGGQPGVNDVAKQLWYESCLSSAASARGFNHIANVFVVPGPAHAALIRAGGAVELASFGKQRVGIVWLAALSALQHYADGRPLPTELVSIVCREAVETSPKNDLAIA